MEKPTLQTTKYYVWSDCVKYLVAKYGVGIETIKHEAGYIIKRDKLDMVLDEVRANIHEFNESGNDSYNHVPEDGHGYFDTPEVIEAVRLFMNEFSTVDDDSERSCFVYIGW